MTQEHKSRKQRKAQAHEFYLRGDQQQHEGNLKSAFRLLLMAAKLGDADAQFNLGYTYQVGLGVRQNRSAAKLWYRKAYLNQRGWGIAASNLGILFRDEENYHEAIRWFRRAVRNGDIEANLELATIYLQNPRQRDKAVACLQDILKATPPVGVGEDAQHDARKLLAKIEKVHTG